MLIFVNLLTAIVSAQELPLGLQKIIDHNQKQSVEFAIKISFFIAFIAGILGILSPCILPFLPAYFSYTFKEKTNITKMTFIFFLGFALVFVSMGVIAGLIGEQLLTNIQSDWLVVIAGLFILTMGILSLTGKKFTFFLKSEKHFKNDFLGTFLFGMFFAVGWTACLGPILAGILGIGAILHNVKYAALLLFVYALGNFIPLFIFSILYDKFNLGQTKLFKGWKIKFSIFGKKIQTNSTNLISGLIFIILGLFIIIYRGTAKVNKFDLFNTKQYFYDYQNLFIAMDYSNIIGVVVFILFIAILGYFLMKKQNDTQSVKGKYDRYSAFYDIVEWPLERFWFSRWRKKVVSNLKGNVLEVGVGTGKNLKYYSDDAKVTAIDLSSGMLGKAIKESKKFDNNFSLLKMDAEHMRFKDNTFDVVICTFVLCSVPDPIAVAKEMRRVCKKDGKVIMMEHVLSKNRVLAFFQKLHNPITKFLFGFNLDRNTVGHAKKAGFKKIKEKNLVASNDIFKLITCEP